jgi:cell division protein ZapD
VIIYEYPFNERIRTLLRLEDLFHKGSAFLERDGPQEHHVVLLTLFEILDVAGRADLKMDLIQELERQHQSLLGFRNNPEISEAALAGALGEIENARHVSNAQSTVAVGDHPGGSRYPDGDHGGAAIARALSLRR